MGYAEPAFDLHILEHARLAKIPCSHSNNFDLGSIPEFHVKAATVMVILCNRQAKNEDT